MALRIDDISINTLIGSGSSVAGNIKINGFVRLDGDIKGNLETDGNAIVGDNARMQGNLTAKSVVVSGIILGDVTASDSVKLLKSSVVIGDIISRKIQIEGSATVQGHCISIKAEDRFKTESEKYLQSKAITQTIKEKVSL